MNVNYNKDFLWGECCDKEIVIDGHTLCFRYKLTTDQGVIFQAYECKKCNALLIMNFYRGKQFYSYISFPHIFFKNHNCGKKVNIFELLKIVCKRLDIRTYKMFKAGLFSRFPLCCIFYFCLIRSLPADPGFYAQIKHALKTSKYNKNYLLCPVCEIRNHSVVCRQDSYLGECTGASLFEAIKSRLIK